MSSPESSYGSRVTGRTVAGIVLVLLGVLFTLDNFGVIDAGDVFRFGPLLLVGAGVVTLSRARLFEQKVAGTIFLLVGGALLLRNLDLISLRLRDVWPLFLVLGGGLLVWASLRRRDRATDAVSSAAAGGRATTDGALLNEFAVMGGGERVIRDPDFRGGEITAIMGGFEIDLRLAGMKEDSAEIEIFTLWGGVDLKVPEEWNVVVKGVPILGGFSNSARSGGSASASGAPRKTLVVRGTVVMGGVEVKN